MSREYIIITSPLRLFGTATVYALACAICFGFAHKLYLNHEASCLVLAVAGVGSGLLSFRAGRNACRMLWASWRVTFGR